MKLPYIAAFLLRRCAPPDRLEDILGDLDEVHGARVARHGRWGAILLTTLEALEVAGASLLLRIHTPRAAPVSWIDLKLGVRMLAKYPGLTVIGGLAMAFGIFAGAACFEFYSQVLHPQLPFDDGDRVVDISLLDERTQRGHGRYLYDFDQWRTHLTTIEDVGAARLITPNLATGGGAVAPVRAAAMTASAFRMTRVAPLSGRTLEIGDEVPDAPNVAVIGYDVWQNQLGADPDVLGRSILLGGLPHTVVGLMPRGFGFPRSEQLWVPLRFDRSTLAPLEGTPLMVFGRLAAGRRLDDARTELNMLIGRSRIEHPDVYEHLHGRVFPYVQALLGTHDLTDGDRVTAMSINIVAWLCLVLVCGNVALLMFARTAAREGEIVVRTALGASRRRIVLQLFSEALVLAAVAGLVGLGAAAYGFELYALEVLVGDGPAAFWFDASLSPRTVVYAAALVVVTAMLTGALPALMITSKKVDARLRSASAGGGGIRLGGVWTAIIVIQVAATVTFPAIGWFVGSEAARIRAYEPDFATDEFLATGLRLNARADLTPSDSTDTYAARLARTAQELTERLEAEPWVKGVTRTTHLPGTPHGWRRIEMDEGGEAPRSELDEKGPGRWVYGGVVGPNFFDVIGTGALVGRTFDRGDAHPDARTVVVTQAFVDRVLGGRNPVGRQLRYLGSREEWDGVVIGDEPGPWYRIIGVVPDPGLSNGAAAAGFYHAVPDESLRAPTLLVRVNGPPASFAGRVRGIAGEVEPDLTLVQLRTLEEAKQAELRPYRWWVSLLIAVSSVAVLLSLAGIYAAMSFAVARRTREIGVRVALGAGSARLVWEIFRRPLMQVAAGIAVGVWITAILSGTIDTVGFWGKPLLVLLGYAAVVTSVCLLACAEPVRRALAIEPSEALAAE